jgi:DNA-directed RNA polymerase specialized sigma24 family protein
MSPGTSVTLWLDRLKDGDEAAAQRLWERYFARLVGLARAKLRGAPRQAADEDDIALSAFDSFCRGAEAGRFPRLNDRDSLWHLLVVLTARKAAHLIRDATRQKRGGGAGIDPDAAALDELLSREPTPAFAAEVADECRRLLGRLGDPELEAVALAKLEGHTVEEIAAKLGYATRSIKRKLQMIRDLWEREAPP